MKRYITIIAMAGSAMASMTAQTVVDAMRFGSTEIIGTARYRAMGGAFGAVGGDPSCASDNPAGLAIYRSTNLFTITPHLGFTGIESKGTEHVKQSDNNVAVSNLSAIFSFKNNDDSGLINFNLGIGFNRKMENTSKYDMSLDVPANGSFANYLTNQANDYLNGAMKPGTAFDWDNSYTTAPFMSMLAYNTSAITNAPNNPYAVVNTQQQFCQNLGFSYLPYQRLYTSEKTRLDHYNISAAMNFNDRLYLGVTMAITDFNSTIESEFDEDHGFNTDYDSDSYLAFDNRFETKGTGVGFNLGLIWTPIDNWRLGAAVHTPTWGTMTEYNEGSMLYNAELQDGKFSFGDWESYYDSWKYDFATPWEYQFSTAVILGTQGLISLEYDLRDFSTMEYSYNRDFGLDNMYFKQSNAAISKYLDKQHTIKVGGEYRVNRQLSLRAGYAYVTSPCTEQMEQGQVDVRDQNICYYSTTKPNFQTLGAQYYVSAGAGWRAQHWYFDLSYVYQHSDQHAAAFPGDFGHSKLVDLDLQKQSWDLTLGYRF